MSSDSEQDRSSTYTASTDESPKIRMTNKQMELLDSYIRDYYDSNTKQLRPPHGTSYENFWTQFVMKLNEGAKNQWSKEKWQKHIQRRIGSRASTPKQTILERRLDRSEVDEPKRKKKRCEYQGSFDCEDLAIPNVQRKLFAGQINMKFNTVDIQNSVTKHMKSLETQTLNNGVGGARKTDSTPVQKQDMERTEMEQRENKFREDLRILRGKNKLAYQQLREKQENLLKMLKLKKELLLSLTKANGRCE